MSKEKKTNTSQMVIIDDYDNNETTYCLFVKSESDLAKDVRKVLNENYDNINVTIEPLYPQDLLSTRMINENNPKNYHKWMERYLSLKGVTKDNNE